MTSRHRTRRGRVRGWVNGALLAVLVAVIAVGAFGVLSGRYHVRPVLSGSMQPGLPVGGIVITERVPVQSLQVRDVVVFHRPDEPDELVVHRIIKLTTGPGGSVIRTQGDANDTPDPWRATLHGDTAYRAVFSLPLIGYAAVWVHSPTGRQTYVIVGLLLLVIALTGIVSRYYRSRRTAATRRLRTVLAGTSGQPRSAAMLSVPMTRSSASASASREPGAAE